MYDTVYNVKRTMCILHTQCVVSRSYSTHLKKNVETQWRAIYPRQIHYLILWLESISWMQRHIQFAWQTSYSKVFVVFNANDWRRKAIFHSSHSSISRTFLSVFDLHDSGLDFFFYFIYRSSVTRAATTATRKDAVLGQASMTKSTSNYFSIYISDQFFFQQRGINTKRKEMEINFLFRKIFCLIFLSIR